jgi:hypothetical protein
MPISFVFGRVDQLLALQFWAPEYTITLIVTREAKLFRLVSHEQCELRR